jgi:NAD+ kinase
MLVAVYNRIFEIKDVSAFETLFNELYKINAKIILFETLVDQLRNVIPLPVAYETFSNSQDLDSETDFIISMGGDGTILDTVTFVAGKNIPILGINLGRLGFLAGTTQQEIAYAIDALNKGTYLKDERSLLNCTANVPLFSEAPFALNDFTIQRKDSSALVKIHTYVNGEFLCTYWADGIIVSTPTGSTGYSLSCGGPIIAPQTNSFIITPVAPHNLNVRPIVIPDTSIVSFEVEGRAKEYLCSMDARSEIIDARVSIAIKKEDFNICLVRLENQNFLNTMRTKLYWGMDKRN